MPRTATIKIKWAELNVDPIEKTIKAGTTVKQLAEELDLSPSDLFVNGTATKASYVLKAKDFVCQVTNVSGGC